MVITCTLILICEKLCIWVKINYTQFVAIFTQCKFMGFALVTLVFYGFGVSISTMHLQAEAVSQTSNQDITSILSSNLGIVTIIQDIKYLSSSFIQISFDHAFKESNMVANNLLIPNTSFNKIVFGWIIFHLTFSQVVFY